MWKKIVIVIFILTVFLLPVFWLEKRVSYLEGMHAQYMQK
jgi:hypothetical protein